MENGVMDISGRLDVFRLRNELIGFIISESEMVDYESWWDEINEYFECDPGTLVLWDGSTFLNVGDGKWVIDGDGWESDGVSGIAGWFQDIWS